MGDFALDDGDVTFTGGVLDAVGQIVATGGNFINDQKFGEGTISATITFHGDPSESGAGIILYYDPVSSGLVVAQLGIGALVSLRVWTSREWLVYATQGSATQLVAERPYRLQVKVTGSRALVSLNQVNLIDTNLRATLPVGQTGVWAMSSNDVSFSDFDVEPALPKLFVIMQFTEPFNELYTDVIQPIAEELGFNVARADETYGPGIIIADIERQIVEARAMIADITPNNPNVYWEVGYGHALRKQTILIAERNTELPFDVSPFRTLFYDDTIAGKAQIEEGLRNHLKAIQSESGL